MTTNATSSRPWPIVVLTALGAWLAALPLLIAVGLLLGDTLTRGVGAYAVGGLTLLAAVVVLRAKDLPLFVEQLAIPALLVGGGTFTMGVASDFDQVGGALVLLAVVMALAALVPQAWLRTLLGALAAGLLGVALVPESQWGSAIARLLWVLHGLLVVWFLATLVPMPRKPLQALIDALAHGWLLATVAALCWTSGTSFLVAGAVGANELGQLASELRGHQASHPTFGSALQWLSSSLVLAAAALGARAWPALRSQLALAVAAVLAVLAWWMPTLGATLWALMVVSLSHQWRLAGACALAATWMLGASYYQLQWPLADKALLLVAAAAALAALVWVETWCQVRTVPAPTPEAVPRATASVRNAPTLALLASVLLTLTVANFAIWQKEHLIAHGSRVFIALAPVDPRSLMQGDYMRLNFAAINDAPLPLLADLGGQRPQLVITRDARGVASVVRTHTANVPLAANEMLIELTPKDGRWVVVTDAWYFKEGDGARWQTAKFGEFRVLPDGRALLVGMADAELKTIAPHTP
ncbi:MAG: hypothetical protein CFE44_13360 [Burkholderiales bacterium PBB4]|nr:MAG: hypothetical protein CFE44_13360 [Burkholderiales bacterium PBB4]